MDFKNIFFAVKFYGIIGSIYIFQFSFMAAFILELIEYNKTGRGIELIYGFLCLWMSIKSFKMKIAYIKSFTDRIGSSLDKLNNSGFNRNERRIFQRKLIQMKSQNKTI